MNKYLQIILLTPSDSNKRLNKSYRIRFLLSLLVLILQVCAIVPIIGSSISSIEIFNLPIIVASIGCLIAPQFLGIKVQKIIKTLLKVSIAKAFGSILLASYITIKYLSTSSHNNNMKLCAFYFGMSAAIDIISSSVVYFSIKKTRTIIRCLRREEKIAQKSLLDTLSTSTDSSECGSATLSDRSSRLSL